jgi:AraC family transcriptional regulator
MNSYLINRNLMQPYPFVEIDDSQDIMQQMTPYIKKHSLELPWDSFYLLNMEFDLMVLPEVTWDAAVITCCTEQKVRNVEISADGQRIDRQLTPGKIGLWKPHFPVGLIWYEPVKISKCVLSLQCLEQIALETIDRSQIELVNCWWDREDPLIFQIIKTLSDEMLAGCPSGKFYGDTLITTLCAHLLCHYTSKNYQIVEHSGGLSRTRLKLAVEYINDRINENISLAEIAAELDISQYHFCRLFKESIGVSPHKYIIQQRIEYAQKLLLKTDTKLADIALATGFANQGHFGYHFRKLTGVTPKQYRES